jgi:hypothetical protein
MTKTDGPKRKHPFSDFMWSCYLMLIVDSYFRPLRWERVQLCNTFRLYHSHIENDLSDEQNFWSIKCLYNLPLFISLLKSAQYINIKGCWLDILLCHAALSNNFELYEPIWMKRLGKLVLEFQCTCSNQDMCFCLTVTPDEPIFYWEGCWFQMEHLSDVCVVLLDLFTFVCYLICSINGHIVSYWFKIAPFH